MKHFYFLCLFVLTSFFVKAQTYTVTSPNGGENWNANSTYSITWTASASSGYVNLYYSTDNGTSWTYINYASAANGSNSYNWAVPNALASTQCRIKVADYYNSAISDISNNVFTITFTPPSITVTSPNGGENWNSNSTYPITWNAANFTSGYVNLYYSTDNGGTWTYINYTSCYNGSNSYNWAVPNAVASTQAKIKVVDYYNTAYADESNNVFTITFTPPSITVTSPNGSENWNSNSTYPITWSASNFTSGYVNLYYSTDNGATWTYINYTSCYNGSNSYNWTVPNAIASTQAKIKVVDYYNTAYADESNNVFTITFTPPSITVTSPNGGENWNSNSTYPITWSASNFTSGYVNLYYSTDNGATWNFINYTTCYNGSNSYNWTIPNAIASTQAKIKVVDYYNNLYADESNSVFTIGFTPPSLTVTSPNGGENWSSNSTYQITWNAANFTSGYVYLYYSIDNGTTWTNINYASCYNGANSYSWTIPNAISSTQCKLKISDYYNAAYSDESNNVFTISFTPPSLTLNSPNGGENWNSNSTYQINWNAAYFTSGYVNLYYSIDNGTSWTLINYASCVNGANTYNWTIPNAVSSTQAKIKVVDYYNSLYADESNSVFTITYTPPSYTVTSPNGGENWFASSFYTISWTASNSTSGYVNLYYSTNGGSTWTLINYASSANGSNSYNWTIPSGTNSSQCKVRVVDYYNASYGDESNTNFTITAPPAGITVTSPNGGEVWNVNTTQNIQWYSTNLSSTYVNLYYSTNGGSTWTYITNVYATNYTYSWYVPTGINSTQCKIKVEDYGNSSNFDVSNANFTINAPAPNITVTAPNGGESWTGNSSYYIYYTASNTSNGYVNLYYSTNGGSTWNYITNTLATSGYYYWSVPTGINSSQCKIKVEDYTNNSYFDVSDANFTITSPTPSLTLTAPNGGENWTSNTSQYIYWNASNLSSSYVDLYYSTDGGNNYSFIAIQNASSGSYLWTIPYGISSTQCKIKVVDDGNNATFDASNAYFTISTPTPSITVIAPNGGETWTSGTYQNITWSASNTYQNYVDISYSINGGNSYTYLTSVSASAGSYQWFIPSVSSTQCRVRVSNYQDTTYNDISNSNFTIQGPQITVTSPNGYENICIGGTYSVTWSAGSSVNNVNILFSSDYGSTFTTIASNVQASLGTYSITVPANLSTSNGCVIKVVSSNNSSVFDTNDNYFYILDNYFNTNAPYAGQVVSVGNYTSITWTYSSCVALSSVDISYSTNGGSTWTNITTNYAASQGSYYWQIPNTPSTTCLVRIADHNNASQYAQTSGVFTIQAASPTLSITNPQSGYNWNTNTGYTIYWNSSNVSTVNISYSMNGGSSYTSLATSVQASIGSYYFTTPATAVSNFCVKVTDASNASVTSQVCGINLVAPTPYITSITNPYQGQVLTVGSQTYIQWNGGNLSNIKIELSTDGGLNYPSSQVISSNYNASTTNYFYWTVPNANSNNCKIRITEINTPSVTATSSTFSIQPCTPTLSISSPYTGMQLTGGSYASIYWSSSCVTNVSIEYSPNAGGTWTSIASNTSATTGSYYWAIPTTATTQGQIRIKDLASGSTAVATSGLFTIGLPTLSLTAPNGGEVWQGGTYHNITWTSNFQNSNYASLEYSTNNGQTWNFITTSYFTNGSGSYAWYVPNVSSSQCKVRVSDYYNSSIQDISNLPFTINPAAAQISLTSPNGGEVWATNLTYYIQWTSVSINSVRIEYTANGGTTWNVISNSYPAANGYYNFTVPNTPSNNCYVRVSDASNPGVSDMSNSSFTIANPSLTITSPNGGEVWQGLTQHVIYWNNNSVGTSSYVNLEYSTNNGASWNYIVYGTSNTGSYTWTVPNTVSTTCRVRVSDYNNSSVSDISNGAFSITAAAVNISLYSPNGGENVGVGSNQTISWYSQNISNVKLEYSIDGGLTYNSIIASTPNYGYYYWTVPNTPSTTCKVRVSDASNANVTSSSNFTFTIATPVITVIAPNGLQNLTGLSYSTISWNSNTLSNYFSLEYTTDLINWNYITTVYSNSSVGSYSWYVPNVNTNLAKIRITDYYLSNVSDMSDTTFSINLAPASVQVTSPNGGENFAVGSNYYIHWNSTSISSVNIEYSINGGSTYNSIATAVAASNASYLWAVPNTPSQNCLVRITDANNPSLTDVSNNSFTIQAPYITVTTPNGGETYNTGSSYYIQWNSSGVNYVNIAISTDGGSSYSDIVSSTSNTGYYLYTPTSNQVSNQCKIRVRDSFSPLSDASNNNFTIQTPAPSLVLTSPNGGQTWTVGNTQYITWNSTSVSQVKIEFSSDSGATWNIITQSYNAATGYYSWLVPNTVTNDALVRISNATNSNLSSQSGLFTIAPNTPSLVMNSPNGGENLQTGSYQYISWYSNNVSCVNIEISYNNGITWSTIASNVSGNSYYWYVPQNAAAQCFIRVTDCYTALTDESNFSFTISTPTINTNTITLSSVSDNAVCKGDSIMVYYQANGVYNNGNYFTVQLSDATGSFNNPIAIGTQYSTSLNDSILAIIPNYTANGNNYVVRVVSSNLVATSNNSSLISVQGPTVDFVANPYQTMYLLPQEASIQFSASTTGSVASYDWSFGDGGTSTSATPTHDYGTTIYFDVQLTVTDSNGCKATAMKPDYIHTEYYLPNYDIMPPGMSNVNVTGASFTNINTGCFTLSNGNCLVTNNAGTSWTNSYTGLPTGTQLTTASLIPGYWVVGGNNGSICYSTNQGATWTTMYTGTSSTITGIAMTSSNLGFAVGTAGTVFVFDGSNWVPSVISGASSVNFSGVATHGTSGAMAVGNQGAVYYYNGSNWNAITSALYGSATHFTSLYSDVDTVYATTTLGSLYKFVYGNSVWTPSLTLSGTGANFKSVSGKGGNITAVGDSGVVYQSDNGGNSYARYSMGTTNNLTTVAIKKPRGYVGGHFGTGRVFGDTTTTTGITAATEILHSIQVFPNPAKDVISLRIENEEKAQFTITVKDVTGRNCLDVMNQQVEGSINKTVDISKLSAGTYFLFVQKDQQQTVHKISIE